MKSIIVFSITASLVAMSGNAMAGHKYKYQPDSIYDKARVIHVEPVVRTIRVRTPQRECYQEEVRRPVHIQHRHSDGAAIIGGIIGGILGHKLGKGRGGATVAGTLIGASIGKNSARHRDHDEYYEEVSYEDRCTTRVSYHTEERIDGYDVTYRYKGEKFTTRMPYEPGKFIKVRLSISPVVE